MLQVFAFYHFEYFFPVPSGLQSFFEKSVDILMGPPLMVTLCFSLAAFKILPLALAGVAQWIECQPENQRVIGLNPSQGTGLGSQ